MPQPAEALHEQREWLRVTLASIGDAVITTDNQGRVTFLNGVGQSLTGWTLEEASGVPLQTVFKIVNEDTRREVENPATRALREGLVVGLANHTLLIAKDGTERPIDDSAAPIRDLQGQVAGVVLIFRDIAERRKSELALRESEERFRLLIEGVQDYAIFMLDPSGAIVSWNVGAQRIKGYRADEVIGKHFSIFYPPEAIASGFPEHELKTAAEVGRFEDEGWRLRKDGTAFWANVIITALRDESGRLKGFSKITRDLSERRQLERAKMQAQVLADLNRRTDEFLAMLSHELRNPLSPILNAALLLRLQKNDDPIHQQATAIIERQVGHLTRLVDDLLEVSRFSTGRIRLQQEDLDFRGVVERAVETVRPLIVQRKHQLSVSLGSEPIWLHADSTRMEQVVVNLLTNAAKYTKEGGSVRLTLEKQANEAVLRVADSGMGIAPDLLPVIFDLFTQAERSLDRSQGGLGIGLTIVQRVVSMHGGKVEAHSAGLGHGSEFVVCLPLGSHAALQSYAASDKPAAPAKNKLRVLVVDDNRDAADSLATLLRRLGHDARASYSSLDALELASAMIPDAVLLDIGLPEIDGYEVARRLRENPQLRELRLIAVTGYGQEADRQRAQEAGFDAHMVKPVDLEKVQATLTAPPRA